MRKKVVSKFICLTNANSVYEHRSKYDVFGSAGAFIVCAKHLHDYATSTTYSVFGQTKKKNHKICSINTRKSIQRTRNGWNSNATRFLAHVSITFLNADYLVFNWIWIGLEVSSVQKKWEFRNKLSPTISDRKIQLSATLYHSKRFYTVNLSYENWFNCA